jgi:A/G-specific adenine glycosylase
MLQQTRVAAVLEHYRKFLQRFPTVHVLAAARESSVLATWSGLGYYRRARMLRTAAKQIVRDHDGNFPSTAAALIKLPGIGRYTAAAIASIGFGEPIAVVDGNVQRVLERITGNAPSTKQAWHAAQQLLSDKRPGDFNQAMMELGATVCLPVEPACNRCPVVEFCATRSALPKPRAQIRKKKQVHLGLDLRNDSVFLVRRPMHSSLMPGMWELPEVLSNGESSFTLRHSITVTDYVVKVVRCTVPGQVNGRWVHKSKVTRLPLTGLTTKILKAVQLIPLNAVKSERLPQSSKMVGR